MFKYFLIMMGLFGCVTNESITPLRDEIIKQDSNITVIEYGADWCPACQDSVPVIQELQQKVGFKFIYIDRENVNYQWMEYNNTFIILWLPTISIFKDKKLYYHGPWPLKEKFEELLNDLKGYK